MKSISSPLLFGVAVLAVALAAPACSRREESARAPAEGAASSGPARQPAARVLVVGIDGATWDVLDPAMRAGLMPNLDRLCREGARGILRSMDPTASAVIWTTLATGKVPEKHGVLGFTTTTPAGKTVPVTSTVRRVKALWNIASDAGMVVGFVGWWVTWPAEEVRGFIASDYTWPQRKDEQGFATGGASQEDRSFRTYPPELMASLDRFVKTEERASAGELETLGISWIPRVKGYSVRDMFLKDISLGDMSGYLLDRYRPALFAVYFDGFDAYCHIFWTTWREHLKALQQGQEAAARLPREQQMVALALDRHLLRLDEYVGAVASRAGPGDVVLVISDHGYGDNPGCGPILRGYDDVIHPEHWHTLNGVMAAAGGPIRRGVTVEGATVLDVTPTILALLGLPVGADMDGRVLTEIMTSDFLAAHPVQTLPTLETGARGGAAVESPYDQAVLERLRSLGYLR